MDTVTYPDPRTVEFVHDFLIALRLNTSSSGPLATEFGIRYTPTVITLNPDRREVERSVGFQPPESLIPSLLLAIGKSHMEDHQYQRAISAFEKLLSDYATSEWSSEADNLRQYCIKKKGSEEGS